MAIQDTLPDPLNLINTAGQDTGSPGPGFASVKLSSNQPIMRSRTRSGRLVSRAVSYHMWEIDISYNPLTKQEFTPVFSFLLEKRGSLKPFYLQLPQYRNQVSVNKITTESKNAGATSIEVNSTTGIASGMLFNIVDTTDSTHTKTYMVTRASGTTLSFIPGLQKDVSTASTIDLITPKIKVIQTSDTQEYALGSNNLYSFSLKLEEACS